MNDKADDFSNILAKRAYQSLTGKAVIGVVGGLILLLVLGVRKCNDRNRIEFDEMSFWVESNIIRPVSLYDSSKVESYKAKFQLNNNSNIDSVIGYVYNQTKGGFLIKEINSKQTDSIASALKTGIIYGKEKLFYVHSLDSSDFYLLIKDSLVSNVMTSK